MSLDEGDNEVSRFLSYLTLALREIRDDIGQTALDTLQASQSPSVEVVLTGLINEVATIPDDFAVVLDDYHCIVAQPVHDALGYLLKNMPSQIAPGSSDPCRPTATVVQSSGKGSDDRGTRRRLAIQ